MVIVHSYISLPEGMHIYIYIYIYIGEHNSNFTMVYDTQITYHISLQSGAPGRGRVQLGATNHSNNSRW